MERSYGPFLSFNKTRKLRIYCVPGFDKDTKVVGLARVGCQDQRLVYCSLEEMSSTDLGGPLHSLIIPGDIQPLEEEYLNQFLTSR